MLFAQGSIVFACGIAGAHAQIHLADISLKTTTPLASLTSKPSASPVVFPSGDLLVGTNDGKLHRLAQASGWNDAWSATASLGAAVRGVAISAPDVDGVVAYATTAQGQLHAVDKDGRTVWSTSAEPAPEPLGVSALSFPTIAPADGARAGSLPTLYAGSDDGHVYAVVVDTGLDPASPWPKAHRDLRNTSNADAPKDW
ncbi:MAG TPA: PQQ-binding-like beta-propeller repeat protein [Anaeromyxobacteraceae bacterium]